MAAGSSLLIPLVSELDVECCFDEEAGKKTFTLSNAQVGPTAPGDGSSGRTPSFPPRLCLSLAKMDSSIFILPTSIVHGRFLEMES
jgi:hypothetical protein